MEAAIDNIQVEWISEGEQQVGLKVALNVAGFCGP